ncbi:MAG: nicotinamide mononucleotide transporter [Rhodobacteraceae bacterium]|nr:nicotinamide mononucleotide transporter [Paracoccaceae bacterium]
MSELSKEAFDAWKDYLDKIIEKVGWVWAFLVVLGYYLNANQHLSSWLVWIAGNICVAGYSTYKKAYPTALMSFVIALINIYGYFAWK